MVVFKSTLKLSLFALSLSMMMSGCILADLSKNEQSKSLYGINLSHLSLAERKELEEVIYNLSPYSRVYMLLVNMPRYGLTMRQLVNCYMIMRQWWQAVFQHRRQIH